VEYLEHTASWFPTPVRIGGVGLCVLTLGHYRLLEAASSPLTEGGDIDAEDVALALWILSRPWRSARKAMINPRRMAARLALFGALHRRAISAENVRKLVEYVKLASFMPDRYSCKKTEAPQRVLENVTAFGMRLALRVCEFPWRDLCHENPGAWSCVWDVPLSAAMAIATAQDERNGQEFQTPEETAEIEKDGGGNG